MAIALLSVPTPHQLPIFQRPYTSRSNNNTNTWLHGSTALIRYPSKPIIRLCSSTSIVEDGPSSPEAIPVQSESATEDTDQGPFSGCKACGREEVEKGCNGEGRIQGGIATFPGFGWWPIKAYRPCPGFVASGGRYRRRGQSMDEVAFGRGEKRTPVRTSSEDQLKQGKGRS